MMPAIDYNNCIATQNLLIVLRIPEKGKRYQIINIRKYI